MNRYALLDWDYTLRKGYTLTAWIEYLCTRNVFSASLPAAIASMQAQYDAGMISHDEYAMAACREYAAARVAGCFPVGTGLLDASGPADDGGGVEVGGRRLPGFCREQGALIYSFTEPLFQLLHRESIDAIVVSGAPGLILKQYQETFHIRKILAFEPEIRNGQYTGAASANYGFHKENAVQLTAKLYGTTPFLALGDSSSDIPLLMAARHAVCIGRESFLPDGKEAACLSPASAPEDIIAEISSLIHSA